MLIPVILMECFTGNQIPEADAGNCQQPHAYKRLRKDTPQPGHIDKEKNSKIPYPMKNNGSQKCAGSFRHPGKHDAKQGSIYPLHQVPMVNAENHAGKYHGNRRAEYLFGFPIDNSPEYQFLGKRR